VYVPLKEPEGALQGFSPVNKTKNKKQQQKAKFSNQEREE